MKDNKFVFCALKKAIQCGLQKAQELGINIRHIIHKVCLPLLILVLVFMECYYSCLTIVFYFYLFRRTVHLHSSGILGWCVDTVSWRNYSMSAFLT